MPKWNWRLGQLIHVDVESDGLIVPGQPYPLMLEVACVLTDASLKILDHFEAVIRHPNEVLDGLDPPPIVLEMHEKNGLWNALRHGPTVEIAAAEQAILSMLDRHPDPEGRPLIWAGFSPAGIDRPLVAYYMPTLYGRIHHRSIDVSSLKLAMLNYAGVDIPKDEAVHRALPDALKEIALLREYREALGRQPPVSVGEARLATVG